MENIMPSRIHEEDKVGSVALDAVGFNYLSVDNEGLRDKIAIAAMSALIQYGGWKADGKIGDENYTAAESVARQAYLYADDMLKARKSK